MQRRRAHPPEMELLAARQDGCRHHLDLGGGEDEHQVRRRLLDDLEQSVEGLAREAVDLVDHHHLVGVARGAVAQALGELAHLLHLGVGGGVDLDHVEVGAGGDLAAGAALVAGIGQRRSAFPLGEQAALAVERLRQHPRGRGLTDAADAREQIRLRDAAIGDRVAQRGGDGVLADDRREILRPPLAGESLVGHVGGGGKRRVKGSG